MVASRLLEALQGGRNSLDMPVAALAGLAVAFVAFAAPADLLAGLVGVTGISSIVPAAEPPLGMTARMALGAGGGLLIFAVAFLLLRWLGRFGGRSADDRDEITELEVPRLRRRDIHPDAPARPPLLAVHELGEPELELDQLAPEPAAAPPEMAIAATEMPLAAEVPPQQLLARKPDRQAAPVPSFAQSFEPEPPAFQAPSSGMPAAANRTVADAIQDDQARAYALSQRNWADFEPEPEQEAIAEREVEADHPSLAEPAEGSDTQWPSSSPEAWGFSEEESPAPRKQLPDGDEASQTPEPEVAPDRERPFVEPEPWDPSPASWTTDPAAPALEPIAERESVREIAPPAETWQVPEPEPMVESQAIPEWTAQIQPEPFDQTDPLPEADPLTEWTGLAEPAPTVAAEPELEAVPQWNEPEPAAQWTEAAEPQLTSVPQPVAAPEPQVFDESERQVAEESPPPIGSIAELMERLEKGLARHRMTVSSEKPGPAPAARPAAIRPVSPDPADDRLQHAIEKLQRFASRQD